MPRATCQTSVHFRFSAILIKSFFHLTQFLSLCNVRLQWPLYIGLIATIMESEMVFWDWTALGAFLKCIGGIQSKAISIDLVHNMYLSTNLPFHICTTYYVVIAAFHPILLKAVEEGHLGTYAPRKNWQNIRGAAGQSWIQSIEIRKARFDCSILFYGH